MAKTLTALGHRLSDTSSKAVWGQCPIGRLHVQMAVTDGSPGQLGDHPEARSRSRAIASAPLSRYEACNRLGITVCSNMHAGTPSYAAPNPGVRGKRRGFLYRGGSNSGPGPEKLRKFSYAGCPEEPMSRSSPRICYIKLDQQEIETRKVTTYA